MKSVLKRCPFCGSSASIVCNLQSRIVMAKCDNKECRAHVDVPYGNRARVTKTFCHDLLSKRSFQDAKTLVGHIWNREAADDGFDCNERYTELHKSNKEVPSDHYPCLIEFKLDDEEYHYCAGMYDSEKQEWVFSGEWKPSEHDKQHVFTWNYFHNFDLKECESTANYIEADERNGQIHDR